MAPYTTCYNRYVRWRAARLLRHACCDGGFLTFEEQEYRYAKRLDIGRHGYRYRDGRRKLIQAY